VNLLVVAGFDDDTCGMSASAPEPEKSSPAPAPAPVHLLPPAPLMGFVVVILGVSLIALVVFEGVAVLQGKSTNSLNTLTSMIVGGFVGFLTPHVAGSVSMRRRSAAGGVGQVGESDQ
jgi:hypothetical protein